jgi:hypothetical protein
LHLRLGRWHLEVIHHWLLILHRLDQWWVWMLVTLLQILLLYYLLHCS